MVGNMKRTNIYLDDEDRAAIAAIRSEHEARGVKLTDASAVRYALRDVLRRLEQRRGGR